jgi:hypothetical protein
VYQRDNLKIHVIRCKPEDFRLQQLDVLSLFLDHINLGFKESPGLKLSFTIGATLKIFSILAPDNSHLAPDLKTGLPILLKWHLATKWHAEYPAVSVITKLSPDTAVESRPVLLLVAGRCFDWRQ